VVSGNDVQWPAWTAVEDGVPEEGVEVMVSLRSPHTRRRMQTLGTWEVGQWTLDVGGDRRRDVTHWMPAPPPPDD
jgi:hypothetical protein